MTCASSSWMRSSTSRCLMPARIMRMVPRRSFSPARMAAFMSSWIRSLSVTASARVARGSARRPHPVARDALHVALDGRSLLAFPFLGGLLVEFAPPELREDAGLLAGTLEAPQGGIEVLVFA